MGAGGSAAGVRIALLGGFAVEIDGTPSEQRWRLRKAKTLVKLLALAPGHRLHRDVVLEELWPEAVADAAGNNLHQAVHAARRVLDAAVPQLRAPRGAGRRVRRRAYLYGCRMRVAGEVVVGIVAALHLYFLYLEMVVWTTPRGRAIFGTTAEQAEQSAALAKNQGLYNGFLAAALVLGLAVRNAEAAFEFKLYGLACVLVAAVFGALTVSRRILLVQGAPAVVGLALVLAGGR